MTPTIGFHCSHEQMPPSQLLTLARRAADAGFGAGMCSDHFAPFSERQGHSGFAWSFLGAAMASVPGWTFGTVNAPGQRYHPALIAQATATLAEMFPDRFWVAMGSGQFVNEHITGERWPSKAERDERLADCVRVIRALWAGETVTERGKYFNLDEAKLHTRSAKPPLIFGAALSERTARLVGRWADGLITVANTPEKLRPIIDAFREGGGAGKPMYLQVHVAYAPTEAQAVQEAYDQWRTNVFPSAITADVKLPAQLDAIAERVRPEDMHAAVRISADLGRHLAWLQQDVELGFEHLYLHESGSQQDRFIDAFADKVLPKLR